MNEAGAGPLLAVEGLVKRYPSSSGAPVAVVKGVGFSVEDGQTLGLVGESGSGKSTTGMCVLQLIRPTEGSVRLAGEELVGMPLKQLRRRRREMQIIFQDPLSSLDPRMSVTELLLQPLRIHRTGSRVERARRVRELLDLVGMPEYLSDRRPFELSGGQCQRVGIARALALNPKLIVCDEPVSALDMSVQAQIINLLRDLQTELGLSYLFISHDLAVVRAMSDTIAVMRAGEIVEHGAAESVYSHPQNAYTQRLLAAVPTVRTSVNGAHEARGSLSELER